MRKLIHTLFIVSLLIPTSLRANLSPLEHQHTGWSFRSTLTFAAICMATLVSTTAAEKDQQKRLCMGAFDGSPPFNNQASYKERADWTCALFKSCATISAEDIKETWKEFVAEAHVNLPPGSSLRFHNITEEVVPFYADFSNGGEWESSKYWVECNASPYGHYSTLNQGCTTQEYSNEHPLGKLVSNTPASIEEAALHRQGIDSSNPGLTGRIGNCYFALKPNSNP
jgi:hypothetical protein